MHIELTPRKGMEVPSVVMTNTKEEEWHIDTKEDEKGDIWCKVLESKNHKEDDLLDVLGKGKPEKNGVDVTYDYSDGCVVRNFWNYSRITTTLGFENDATSCISVALWGYDDL